MRVVAVCVAQSWLASMRIRLVQPEPLKNR